MNAMLYKVYINKENCYVHANCTANALRAVRRRYMKKFGVSKITEIYIKDNDKWKKIMLSPSEQFITQSV